ncbi:MAG: MFS transporter [Pigmentiphaga sp.]
MEEVYQLPQRQQRFARRQFDWRVIALIGVAHASSHFFQLVIPSLFVPLSQAFGLNFAQLGMLATVFYVVSGIGQAASGFVVDKLGPRPVLWFGLSGFVVAGLLLASATSYGWLLFAAFVAGLGNCVFHPVDFSILNHRVSSPRLGHAFSTHGMTGNLGWALTPIFITTLTYLYNWRVAALGASVLLALVLLATVLGRRLIDVDVRRNARKARKSKGGQATAISDVRLRALLVNPVVWGAFAFFLFASLAGSAVMNYTLPILGSIHQIAPVVASSALSAYMVAGALGMAAGGFLVSNNPKTERTVAATFFCAALMLTIVGMGWVPSSLAVPCVALAGFFSGVAGPSRDMLVRRVTPRGASGSVYGLVYSGMDTGSAIGPLLFGIMLDAGLNQGPYVGASLGFIMASLCAAFIGYRARKIAQA